MLLNNPTWQKNQQDLKEALAAGKAALNTPCPHPRSPAFAIQRIAQDTYYQIEAEGLHPELWLIDLYRMELPTVGKYIAWDEDWKCWSDGGEYHLSGKSILADAVRWAQSGLDMSRSPRDNRHYPGDEKLQARSTTAIAHIERSLMPLQGELLRRVIVIAEVMVEEMHFDVWLAPQRTSKYPYEPLFHWAYRSSNTLRTLERSAEPILNSELEGFVAPKFLEGHQCIRHLINQMGAVV